MVYVKWLLFAKLGNRAEIIRRIISFPFIVDVTCFRVANVMQTFGPKEHSVSSDFVTTSEQISLTASSVEGKRENPMKAARSRVTHFCESDKRF